MEPLGACMVQAEDELERTEWMDSIQAVIACMIASPAELSASRKPATPTHMRKSSNSSIVMPLGALSRGSASCMGSPGDSAPSPPSSVFSDDSHAEVLLPCASPRFIPIPPADQAVGCTFICYSIAYLEQWGGSACCCISAGTIAIEADRSGSRLHGLQNPLCGLPCKLSEGSTLQPESCESDQPPAQLESIRLHLQQRSH